MGEYGHIGAEKDRGACIVCGARPPFASSCPKRSGKWPLVSRAVSYRMDRERSVQLNVNTGGRPDGWG